MRSYKIYPSSQHLPLRLCRTTRCSIYKSCATVPNGTSAYMRCGVFDTSVIFLTKWSSP